ncbi:hypothetical protein Syun_001097 [Stephania yunnanensis]|uniref:LOB domain-containing protein n=1 Tax=Stephania yunnanensis TaxID=152371 RepID=A0AAP0LD31_9MAGN
MDSMSPLETAKTSTTTTTALTNSSPPISSPSSPSQTSLPLSSTPHVVVSPCAACKILRRRCTEKCVLAPYFPPNEPLKFTIAHRVFGASNIIKFLQELPEVQRVDAVSSMVYEANARIRDPIYGSAGVICQLQKQVSELQEQLARAQAEVVSMQCQQTNLMTFIFMEMAQCSHSQNQQCFGSSDASPSHTNTTSTDDLNYCSPDDNLESSTNLVNGGLFFEDNITVGPAWEPLWT